MDLDGHYWLITRNFRWPVWEFWDSSDTYFVFLCIFLNICLNWSHSFTKMNWIGFISFGFPPPTVALLTVRRRRRWRSTGMSPRLALNTSLRCSTKPCKVPTWAFKGQLFSAKALTCLPKQKVDGTVAFLYWKEHGYLLKTCVMWLCFFEAKPLQMSCDSCVCSVRPWLRLFPPVRSSISQTRCRGLLGFLFRCCYIFRWPPFIDRLPPCSQSRCLFLFFLNLISFFLHQGENSADIVLNCCVWWIRQRLALLTCTWTSDMTCVSSCRPDPSHRPPSHHDSRRPGGDAHPRTRGGEPDDPPGPPTLCGQHPLWYHRGEQRPQEGPEHSLDEFVNSTSPSLACLLPAGVYDGLLQCPDAFGWSHSSTWEPCSCSPDQPRQELCLPWGENVKPAWLNSIFKEKNVRFTHSSFVCSFVQWMKQHRQWHLTASSFKARAWRSAVPTITSPCLAWARIPVSMCLVQRQFMVFNFF